MSEQVKNLLGGSSYNPDVLECLANLSNDEVFTPPKVVNSMLDMLPPETWTNPNLTFLDPACKTGVFLREIAKRLIDGLADQIPDLQERLDHIFHKQLYGIAVTELTALTSRRSLYCSKYANSEYSVSRFNNPSGNIRFVPIDHVWQSGKCKFCGANEEQYRRAGGLESHAYEFIHTNNPEEIFGMKFDVIIGNPPYQLADGGSGASATAIYNKFVDNGLRIKPKYLSMIVPSRWMSGGKGLDSFRRSMMSNDSIVTLVDYPNSSDCFAGVDIAGGVCYFLIDSSHHGSCKVITRINDSESIRNRRLDRYDVIVRWNIGEDIVDKVLSFREPILSDFISVSKPFGLRTFFNEYQDEPSGDTYKLYLSNQTGQRKIKYIKKDLITCGRKYIDKWKVLLPGAYRLGSVTDGGAVHPIIAEPNSVCTESFLVAYTFDSELEAKNFISYVRTRFFRFLVYLRKTTQHAVAKVYRFVPIQDFSKPWTDEELYKKYELTDEEIKFIEDYILPMEDN